MGDFRYYLIPDWLYLNANLLIGFPLLLALLPSLGAAVPLGGETSIFLENQFIAAFVGGIYGFWQVVLGVEVGL